MKDRVVRECLARRGRIALRVPLPVRQVFWSSLSAIEYHNSFTCTVSSSVSQRK